MALGAAYYQFPSKDALLFAFDDANQAATEARARAYPDDDPLRASAGGGAGAPRDPGLRPGDTSAGQKKTHRPVDDLLDLAVPLVALARAPAAAPLIGQIMQAASRGRRRGRR